MTTTNDLHEVIGRTGILRGDTVGYRVSVLDAKQSYGVVRYLVVALDGDDRQAWVNAERVALDRQAGRSILEAQERAWAKGDNQ